ncbi:hypothetical protein [Salipiger aestuarii]|uniref:Uncharacterized protein n=1 Tax=Salipiger aestuarii TaxID=568098 RepID=A0A327YDE7_9RHOB|nr:hypothetical protein [Salipiger aestuarii]EIE52033.1 hypothetical protein C357_05553 [Citreicella sp. 357]RAK16479.1 hypothetical protein ATI53_102015 [Salipiger aestuarii]
MKRIGALSFGRWLPGHGSAIRTATDVLTHSIDLAVAAEVPGPRCADRPNS